MIEMCKRRAGVQTTKLYKPFGFEDILLFLQFSKSMAKKRPAEPVQGDPYSCS